MHLKCPKRKKLKNQLQGQHDNKVKIYCYPGHHAAEAFKPIRK